MELELNCCAFYCLNLLYAYLGKRFCCFKVAVFG